MANKTVQIKAHEAGTHTVVTPQSAKAKNGDKIQFTNDGSSALTISFQAGTTPLTRGGQAVDNVTVAANSSDTLDVSGNMGTRTYDAMIGGKKANGPIIIIE